MGVPNQNPKKNNTPKNTDLGPYAFSSLSMFFDIYIYFLGTPHRVQNQCFCAFGFFVFCWFCYFWFCFLSKKNSEKGRGWGCSKYIIYLLHRYFTNILYIYICKYIYTHKCAYVNMHMHMHKYICHNCLLVCVFCRRCWNTVGMNIWTGWGPVGFQQVMNSSAARDGNITN